MESLRTPTSRGDNVICNVESRGGEQTHHDDDDEAANRSTFPPSDRPGSICVFDADATGVCCSMTKNGAKKVYSVGLIVRSTSSFTGEAHNQSASPMKKRLFG
jgi:hypothetical protein